MGMDTCIIAEIGSVHDGSLGNATRLIDAAAECGVNAVKFQTHIAPAETLPDAPMPPFFQGEPRYAYFERTGFTRKQWQALKAHCEENNVEFLSSPFSIEAVELLEELGISQYKIPSGEVTNLPLLGVVAKSGKPVLLSSGMSSWAELDIAVEILTQHHNDVTILQCTTEYPCEYQHVGLNVMLEMKERYKLPVGLSDHTATIYASLAAVTLGASVIEKHFAFSRKMYGSDAKHSLEPAGFADLVNGIRTIELMMNNPVDKSDNNRFKEMKDIFEKSLVALVDITLGETINPEMIGAKKPGTGMATAKLSQVVGHVAARSIKAHSLITEEDIQ